MRLSLRRSAGHLKLEHEVWKFSMSLLFGRNCAIRLVLSAGIWSLQNAFSAFYLRDITHRDMDTFSIGPAMVAQHVVGPVWYSKSRSGLLWQSVLAITWTPYLCIIGFSFFQSFPLVLRPTGVTEAAHLGAVSRYRYMIWPHVTVNPLIYMAVVTVHIFWRLMHVALECQFVWTYPSAD